MRKFKLKKKWDRIKNIVMEAAMVSSISQCQCKGGIILSSLPCSTDKRLIWNCVYSDGRLAAHRTNCCKGNAWLRAESSGTFLPRRKVEVPTRV